MTGERVWRQCGECYAFCNNIHHDRFGCILVMILGGASLEGHIAAGGTGMKSSEQLSDLMLMQ